MATKSGAVNTLNYIRQEASNAYRDVVPKATQDNIKEIGNILLNDAYQPMLNEFVNNLINRIALTRIENKSFSNPLAMFKKGSVPYGTDIQLIYENPANAESYEYTDAAMAKLLTITDPDTKVAYLRRNRKDLYTKTIAREGLQGAFESAEAFDDFVSSITQSLYSGNYIDEFKYTKALIDGAYEEGKVITEVVSAVSDKATAEPRGERDTAGIPGWERQQHHRQYEGGGSYCVRNNRKRLHIRQPRIPTNIPTVQDRDRRATAIARRQLLCGTQRQPDTQHRVDTDAEHIYGEQPVAGAEKHFHTVAGHPPAERCDGIATHIQTEEVRTDDAAKQLRLAAMQRRGRDDGVAGQATATQQAAPENMQRIESGGGIDADTPQPIRLT